jgi:superfamily I DNA/RNA helicase/Zn-dependent peptidase ImmA (M78 family)
MDAVEIGRQRAAELHSATVAAGADPCEPYAFAIKVAQDLGLDVEAANPGSTQLDGGRATFDPTDRLIVHENVGTDFDRAFLVAHEIGHYELGDGIENSTAAHIDAARAAEPSPAGFDRVIDYGRRQRREVQMDLFARELLLPRDVVRAMHLDQHLSASAIAAKMQAPFDVVAQQLFDALLLPSVVIEPQAQVDKPLNSKQANAAGYRGVGYLLEAGPGTGKTQTLAGRVTGLLDEGIDPRRILVLTYSNKAAGEMAERVAQKSPAAAAAMWIGTFHAFGLDLIRRFHGDFSLPANPRMMDRVEAVELLERTFPRLQLKHYRNIYDPTRVIGDILAAISRAKDEVVDHVRYRELADAMCVGAQEGSDQYVAGEKAREVAKVFAVYEELKRERNALDFGDLVARPVILLEDRPDIRAALQNSYDHVIVDEYQDVNRSSVRLLEAICPSGQNLWVVGDARQSIYRFRGASSFNTTRFGKEDFPSATGGRLDINYRSKQEIVDLFAAFGAGMTAGSSDATLSAHRGSSGTCPELRTITQKEHQSVAIADAIEEMRTAGHLYRDQAVLCTGNEKLAEIGRELERLGIPVLFLGSLFERPEVKDLLSLLSLLVDGRAMGLLRVGRFPEFQMSLGDVAAMIGHLREIQSTDSIWLKELDRLPVSPEARVALQRLAVALDGFDETSSPWHLIAKFLLDRTQIAARIAVAGSISERSQGLALWQFLNFLRVQPADAGLPIRRLLDRIRRLVRIGDDRDLRQIPQAALHLNAVRLMTIHGSKGLEFPCVHLPGLNEDTLPGWPKAAGCLPPDGMIAGAGGDAFTAQRAGEAEERECLFYVAASRAQDRFFLYAATHTKRNAARPLSKYLDRLGERVTRRVVSPSRDLPPEPEAAPIAVDVGGPLRFHATQLSLHETCPRRFLYTHILRVGGRRTESDYMKMHEAVRTVSNLAVRGEVNLSNNVQLAAAISAACDAQELETEGAHGELRALAAGMLRYLGTARDGYSAIAPKPLSIRMGDDEVVFHPDDQLVDDLGNHYFRRIRTGHIRSTETKDLGAAIAILAVTGNCARGAVELVHLADEETTVLALSDKVLANRRKTLAYTLMGIRSGEFAPARSERTCPGCPAFFICGSLPEGRLAINS